VENMYVARKTIKKFIDDAKEKGLETAADEIAIMILPGRERLNTNLS